MTRINLSYLQSYSPIILHPSRPIIPLNNPKDYPQVTDIRCCLVSIGLALLIPIWGTIFVLVNLYQSFFSTRRIRQHLRPQGLNILQEISSSKVVQESFDDLVENANLLSPAESQDDRYFHQHIPKEIHTFFLGLTKGLSRLQKRNIVLLWHETNWVWWMDCIVYRGGSLEFIFRRPYILMLLLFGDRNGEKNSRREIGWFNTGWMNNLRHKLACGWFV